MNSTPIRIACLLWAQIGFCQHGTSLSPADAVEIAETSVLFAKHYAAGGCPRASASRDPSDDIALRIEDGCLGGVSTFSGDYVVNARTGEIRDLVSRKVAVAASDPAVSEVWQEVETTLLANSEASCLLSKAPELEKWRRAGVPIIAQLRTDGDFVTIRVVPTDVGPDLLYSELAFRMNRRTYSVSKGRFGEEDTSQTLETFRETLRNSKKPVELSPADALEALRTAPEIASWIASEPCRRLLVDTDMDGVTYYGVSLVRWCPGGKPEKEAGLYLDKRSGAIFAPQGISIGTLIPPGAREKVAAVRAQQARDREQIAAACSANNGVR